jgi:3-hydroxymyristoyl/3-hydroxydecanoyl-(acyl carrier protein) dehydratase
LTEAIELGECDHRFALGKGFPSDSAFLDGHFPGDPIVPGAMILGYLAAQLASVDLSIVKVGRMKFLRVLRPDVPIEVTVASRGGGAYAEFRDMDGVVASASITLRRST